MHIRIPSAVDCLLATSQSKHLQTLREQDFTHVRIDSPFYDPDRIDDMWIAQGFDVPDGCRLVEGHTLTIGSRVIMVDHDMAMISLGCDRPAVIGQILGVKIRVPGYVIASVDVFYDTRVGHGQQLSQINIAVPNYLFNLTRTEWSPFFHTSVLGQNIPPTMVSCASYHFKPPARVWERDPKWKHPLAAAIEEKLGSIREASRYYR